MHGHSLISTSAHFVAILRGPIFVGLQTAALKRHRYGRRRRHKPPAGWPLTPVAYRNPRQLTHSQDRIDRRTLLAAATAQRLPFHAPLAPRRNGGLSPLQPNAVTLGTDPANRISCIGHICHAPRLVWLTLRAASQDPLCCRQILNALGSALGRLVAHQDKTRSGACDRLSAPPSCCTVLPSQGRLGIAKCLPTLLLACAHPRHWSSAFRLGALSCRLTPPTQKRLAGGQPGPQLAARGSAGHPCGDRLCAANQTRKQFSLLGPVWVDIKIGASLFASRLRHLSCQQHIGDQNLDNWLRKSATNPTVDDCVGPRYHSVAFSTSYRATAVVRPHLAGENGGTEQRISRHSKRHQIGLL